jgi:hypothetical protein
MVKRCKRVAAFLFGFLAWAFEKVMNMHCCRAQALSRSHNFFKSPYCFPHYLPLLNADAT